MGSVLRWLLQQLGKLRPRRGPSRRDTDRRDNDRDDSGCTTNCRRLPNTAQRPIRRHDLCRARGNNDRTRNDVTSMYDSSVDVGADIAALNNGNFTASGNNYVVNGRTYGMHPETGRTFPISGPGIHQFSRSEHQFLRMLNERGLDAASQFGRNLPGLSEEAMQRVIGLWETC